MGATVGPTKTALFPLIILNFSPFRLSLSPSVHFLLLFACVSSAYVTFPTLFIAFTCPHPIHLGLFLLYFSPSICFYSSAERVPPVWTSLSLRKPPSPTHLRFFFLILPRKHLLW